MDHSVPRKVQPEAKRALFNLAEHLREDYEFIGAAKSRMRDRTGSSALRLADIAVQPRALQKEILRDQLEKAGGLVKKLSFRHWKELERLVNEKRTGKSVDLPGSVRATRTADSITSRRI